MSNATLDQIEKEAKTAISRVHSFSGASLHETRDALVNLLEHVAELYALIKEDIKRQEQEQ